MWNCDTPQKGILHLTHHLSRRQRTLRACGRDRTLFDVSSNILVDAVREKLKGAMRIPNSDLLYRIGHATRTMNLVLRTHRSDGAINVGVTKGTPSPSEPKITCADIILTKTSTVANSIY